VHNSFKPAMDKSPVSKKVSDKRQDGVIPKGSKKCAELSQHNKRKRNLEATSSNPQAKKQCAKNANPTINPYTGIPVAEEEQFEKGMFKEFQ
jgi:hypothetical protein